MWDNRIAEGRELVWIERVVWVGGKDVISWVRRRCEVPIIFVRINGVIRSPLDDQATFLDQRLVLHEYQSFNAGDGGVRDWQNMPTMA